MSDQRKPSVEHTTDPDKTGFGKRVEQRAQRKLKAQQQKDGSAWFGLGMFGLVGWSISVPSVAGIVIGLWLDRRWPGDASWTLTLLIIGIAVGCLNAWYWIKQETKHD